MADFVAVIRRAVDGLSDNTPEMRVKVYEKARGAVRRQLESMKPQPSDVMIGRQMDKLEAAIGEVESEHAEALPEAAPDMVVDDAAAAPEEADAIAVAPEPAGTVEEYQEPAPMPEDGRPQDVEAHEAPVESDQAVAEPEPEVQQEPEAEVSADIPDDAQHEMPAPETGEPIPLGFHAIETQEEPAGERAGDDADDFARISESEDVLLPAPADDADILPQAEHAGLPEEIATSPQDDRVFASYPGNEGIETDTEHRFDDEPPIVSADHPPLEPVSAAYPDDGLAPISDDEASRDPFDNRISAFQTETVSGKEPEAAWDWDKDVAVDAGARDSAQVSAELPPAGDAWAWPIEKKNEPAFDPELQEEKKPGGWDELEELIGYDRSKDANAANVAPPDTTAIPPVPPLDAGQQRSGSRLFPVLLIAGVLAALGGGGYAYWQERDAVNTWVSDMVAAIIPADTPPAETADPVTEDTGASAPETATGDDSASTTPATEDAGATKFTQRLLPDGGETDPGPASLPAGDGTEEGTSVTAQTDGGTLAGDTQAAAAAESGDAAAVTTPAAEAGQAASTAIPAGTGEKMFLYEERLGQTSPTAIEGTIDWSSKEESPGGDARPEPVIQGQITIPDRGVTALMTIKRNADPSLPASHLIEFVFSMPENFEGGGIDSVQRVAMKRTEQDRGDPLIAVPAKITDDFHMIALNDFPEAITTNTDLLRSRNWIDIPITYRNGRRALLTMQKGTAGAEVFNRVMQSWAGAAGGASANTGQ